MKTHAFLVVFAAVISGCQQESNSIIDLAAQPDSVELFAPGVISTGLYERDMTISPDGNEIIYSVADHRQTRRCMVIIRCSEGQWGGKEILEFSGMYDDIEPFFSADGNRLYFVSNRPVDDDTIRKDYNIWFAERTGESWSDPVPLPPIVNSKQDEFYPSVTSNNNIYFTAVRDNGVGSEDIFVSVYRDGKYMDPVPLDTAVNSDTYEFNAWVSPDESLIVFSSYGRKDDTGGGDLYYSVRDSSDRWQQAINMGPEVNSDKLDYCPFIDMHRRNFYFTSERMMVHKPRLKTFDQLEQLANQPLNGCGNLYRIKAEAIMRQSAY